MPTKSVCVYGSCGSVKSRDPDVTFHRFPIDAVTRARWIARCRNKKLADLTPDQLENKRVCSRHFSPHDFQIWGRQGKRKIKEFAVPIDDIIGEVARVPESSEDSSTQRDDHTTCSSKESEPIGAGPAIGIDSNTFESQADTSATALTPNVDLPQPQTGDRLRPLSGDDLGFSLVAPDSQKKGFLTVTSIEARQARLIRSLRDEVKKCKQKIRRLEAAAQKTSSLVNYAKSVKSLNSNQQAFIDMQLDHRKQTLWSEAEKQFALALFYVSPKAYKHLRDKVQFALPCVSLIRRWISDLNLTTGISQGIFDRLATKAATLTNDERECVLMWDEVSLKKLLEYDPKADQVEGFEDLGELGRTNKLASHALTFMVRGLKYSWKQPIAYFLSHSSVHNEDLKTLILNIIDKVHSIGLVIKAAVCDQGATNRTAITSLGITVEKPFLVRESRKIFFMFDVPHLMKSVRNNLVGKKVFVIDGDEISWGPISELRDLERDHACKAVPKLTDKHINPNTFDKMSVSLATQVFSASVSAALSAAHVTGEIQHPHCSATANFCKRLNDLFDCLNSRRAMDPNPLKRALSSSQPQVQEYLEFSLSWIEKWKVAGSESTLPCVLGFIMTIRSVLQLWDELRETGTFYFITSRVNQDHIENLFSILRGRGGYNPCPSAMTFRRNLQYAMTASLMKPSSSTNCESDDAMVLLPMLEDRSNNQGLGSGAKTDFRAEIDALVNQDSIVDCHEDDRSVSDEIEGTPDCCTDERTSFPSEAEARTEQEAIDCFPIDESAVDDPIEQTHSDSVINEQPIAGCSNDESVADNRIERYNVKSNLPLSGCALENCAKTYVAGYLAFKCCKKFNCSDCRAALTKNNQNYENTNELLIFWKAYSCKENFELGHLKVPTDEFNKVAVTLYNVFTEVFSSEPHRVNLKKYLEICISNTLSKKHADFWCIEGPCREHRKYIIELFVRVHVFNKVKWMSRDLRDHGKNIKGTESTKPGKRLAVYSAGAKPNVKLKKITHQ